MRKRVLYLAGMFLALGCLAGCQKKEVRPGDVPGYDRGEAYLSIWVHSKEITDVSQADSAGYKASFVLEDGAEVSLADSGSAWNVRINWIELIWIGW